MPGFTYRLYFEDGEEAGEASYAVRIKPDDVIHVQGGKTLRVVDVVPMGEEDDDSPYTGLLKVEAM